MSGQRKGKKDMDVVQVAIVLVCVVGLLGSSLCVVLQMISHGAWVMIVSLIGLVGLHFAL